MTKILYKYRSLDNFKYFVDIILNNRLYAAPYKDLNDPMEGQYYYKNGKLNYEIREKIKGMKAGLRICSLSRVNNNELMWSHYTNGQRGVIIGVEVDKKHIIRPIEYNGISYVREENYNEQTAIEILSHKLEVWGYEEEERVFQEEGNFIDVKIKEIITGRRISEEDSELIEGMVRRINPEIRIIKAEPILETDEGF